MHDACHIQAAELAQPMCRSLFEFPMSLLQPVTAFK
jgi:hypothetical protein